jgi:hypothetical protein
VICTNHCFQIIFPSTKISVCRTVRHLKLPTQFQKKTLASECKNSMLHKQASWQQRPRLENTTVPPRGMLTADPDAYVLALRGINYGCICIKTPSIIPRLLSLSSATSNTPRIVAIKQCRSREWLTYIVKQKQRRDCTPIVPDSTRRMYSKSPPSFSNLRCTRWETSKLRLCTIISECMEGRPVQFPIHI